jgi:hypothetical protein
MDNDHFLTVFLAARNNRPDVAFEIVSISKTTIRNLPSFETTRAKDQHISADQGLLEREVCGIP